MSINIDDDDDLFYAVMLHRMNEAGIGFVLARAFAAGFVVKLIVEPKGSWQPPSVASKA